MTRFVYFAWVRERIGKPGESLDIPPDVVTVRDMLLWLKGLGEEYAHALQFPEAIRVAINQEHVDHTEKIDAAGEIGLFPPMTGG